MNFLTLSLILYITSFFFPAFLAANFDHPLGYQALSLGWLGFVNGSWWMGLSWLANMTYVLAMLVTSRWKYIKISLSVLSILFALCTFGINEVPIGVDNSDIAVRPAMGFWIWIGSFVSYLFHILQKYAQSELKKMN